MNIEEIELILNTGSRYITNNEKAHILDYIEYLKSKNNIVESKNIELVIENERLHSIIKEARDLVNKEEFTMKQKYEMREELLEILDKVEKVGEE